MMSLMRWSRRFNSPAKILLNALKNAVVSFLVALCRKIDLYSDG
jgi:hypothetical protein